MMLESLPLLGLGGVVVLTAAAVLFLLVQNELAPAGGLTRRGKLLLAGALGMGIVAFASKLFALWIFERYPEASIRPLLAWEILRPAQARPAAVPRSADLPSAGYTWQALPETAPAPADNPPSAAGIALGRRLFHDTALSRDGKVSCASCHDVHGMAGADGRRVARGIGGADGNRNVPTVWNAAFQSRLFWDGRAASLEEQARGPLLHPKEMGMPSLAAVVDRVRADPAYAPAFALAFGTQRQIDIDAIAKAIATYERSLITPDSRYDRFVRGERAALSAQELRGMALFEKTGCIACHSGPNFSGASQLQPGITLSLFPAMASPFSARFRLRDDPGGAEPGASAGIWRVPSLRNVALTAPYFHNGSVDLLEDAVRIMATVQLDRTAAGRQSVYWSAGEKVVSTVDQAPLSDRDVSDIAAFLRSLSSPRLLARAGPAASPPATLVLPR